MATLTNAILAYGETEIDAADEEKAAIRAAVSRHYGVELPTDAPVFRFSRRLAASSPGVHVAAMNGGTRMNFEVPD